MVHINSATQISPAVNKRSRRCFVRKESPDTYVVKPRLHGKTRRRVRFELRGNQLLAECRNYYSPYQECEANRWGNLCYHCVAALRRFEINSRREQSKAA